jgi:hypothetical protein
VSLEGEKGEEMREEGKLCSQKTGKKEEDGAGGRGGKER